MQGWEFIVALIIAIPVILFPAAFIWYLNVGGIYAALKRAWEKRVARQKAGKGIAQSVEGEVVENPRHSMGSLPKG